MELKKKLVEKPNTELLAFLNDCKKCVFNNSCFFMPKSLGCIGLINKGMECFSNLN